MSAALPESSPGNTGLIDAVGRSGAQVEGGYKQDWTMGRVNNEECKGITIFYENCARGGAQFFLVTAPKVKFGQCSCKGKFGPPVTALPNLPCRNNYMVYYCAIKGERGGGYYYNIGR